MPSARSVVARSRRSFAKATDAFCVSRVASRFCSDASSARASTDNTTEPCFTVAPERAAIDRT